MPPRPAKRARTGKQAAVSSIATDADVVAAEKYRTRFVEEDVPLMMLLRGSISGKGIAPQFACQTMASAFQAYGVSRVFKGLSADTCTKLKPLVTQLRTDLPALSRLQLQDRDKIIAAVEKISDKFVAMGFSRSPCAASKLLCILGVPVPIWDSLARAALGCKSRATYAEFYDLWMTDYAERRQSVECAVEGQEWSGAAKLRVTNEYLGVRVNDMRLWCEAKAVDNKKAKRKRT